MSEGFKKAPYGENQLSLLRFILQALKCSGKLVILAGYT